MEVYLSENVKYIAGHNWDPALPVSWWESYQLKLGCREFILRDDARIRSKVIWFRSHWKDKKMCCGTASHSAATKTPEAIQSTGKVGGQQHEVLIGGMKVVTEMERCWFWYTFEREGRESKKYFDLFFNIAYLKFSKISLCHRHIKSLKLCIAFSTSRNLQTEGTSRVLKSLLGLQSYNQCTEEIGKSCGMGTPLNL